MVMPTNAASSDLHCRHEPKSLAAGLVPRTFPDQQRRLHRDQWLGRLKFGTLWLDGHATCHGLCSGGCAEHTAGGPHPIAIWSAHFISNWFAGGTDFRLCSGLGRGRQEFLVVSGCYGSGGLLQCQWPVVPFCCSGTGARAATRKSSVDGAGRWLDRRNCRPQPCRTLPQPARRAVCWCLRGAGGSGHRRDGVDGLYSLSTERCRHHGLQQWPTAARNHAPTGVYGGLCQRSIRLRCDESAHGRHALGHAAMRAVVR